MKTIKAVLLCMGSLSLITAAPVARENSQSYEYDYDNAPQQAQQAQEPQESASHYDAYIQDVQSAANGGGKKGYSSGSGLRTIAVGSANQAKTALGNQAAAAYQAAYVAKNTLAQSAAQASATAQAALAGKQVILSGLEQQVRDAKVGLQGEEMQLQQAKRAAQAAAQAAQQAMHQVNVIQAALNAAQATSENANEAASQAAGELGAQTAMVGAARQRLHTLQEQLHGVRIDFEATQSAARKAQAAAQQAQANAAEAAAKAAAAGLAANKPDSSHEERTESVGLHPRVLSAKLKLPGHHDTTKLRTSHAFKPENKSPKTLEFKLSEFSRPNYFAPEISSNKQLNLGWSTHFHSSSDPKENRPIQDSSRVSNTEQHPKNSNKEHFIPENYDTIQLKPESYHTSQNKLSSSSRQNQLTLVNFDKEPSKAASPALDQETFSRQLSRNPFESEKSGKKQSNPETYPTGHRSSSHPKPTEIQLTLDDFKETPSKPLEQLYFSRQSSQNQFEPEISAKIQSKSELNDSVQGPKSEENTNVNLIRLESGDSFEEIFPENYVNLESYFNGDRKTDKITDFYDKW